MKRGFFHRNVSSVSETENYDSNNHYCLVMFLYFILNFSFFKLKSNVAVPPWLKKITHRICQQTGLFPSAINHVLINEYLPHQGIMVSV
jgi:hypothetical protein